MPYLIIEFFRELGKLFEQIRNELVRAAFSEFLKDDDESGLLAFRKLADGFVQGVVHPHRVAREVADRRCA